MDARDIVFFGIVIVGIPAILTLVVLMIWYDAADNIRGQIHKGHGKLMKRGKPQ